MKLADIYSQWDGTYQGSTAIHESDNQYLVTYRDEAGKAFRLIFKVKKNPIGFKVRS